MKLRYEVGDRITLVLPIGVTGTVALIKRRKSHLLGDRLYIKRDDEVNGTGKDGLWITNAYSVRELKNAEG